MEDIIDIIIAILFVAVPVIFKGIGNKLEKSGKTERAAKFKKIAESWDDKDDDDRSELYDIDDKPVALDPAPVVVMTPKAPEVDILDYIDKPETVVKHQIKRLPPQTTVKKKPMMLVEDEPAKKGEKIDPKKLVIYSEIMKPKF